MEDVVQKFEYLFNPRSVAFIGASQKPYKWGFLIPLDMLDRGYKGKVYLVNPREKELFGLPVHKSIMDVPGEVDLAFVTVPASSVLDVVRQCARKGVHAILIITAGFGETGDEGGAAQEEAAAVARDAGMLMVGPNCAGLLSPLPSRFYASMPAVEPKPGSISVVSQSGNVCGTIMRLCVHHDMGLARLVSSGNEAFLQTEDFFEYYAADPLTSVIMAYVEGVRDGRRFLDAAKRCSQKKPIVMLKVGKTDPGTRAAKSHTGALAGSAEVFSGACRQAGVIQVADVQEMFDVAVAFARQPLPKGRRVGIISEGGGWGVLAADACAEAGLDVVPLPEETLTELDSFLPSWWSRSNPADMVGGMVEHALLRTTETFLKCPVIDGVIVLGVGFMTLRGNKFRNSRFAGAYGLDTIAGMAAQRDVETVEALLGLIDKYQKPMIIASDTITSAREDNNKAVFKLASEGVLVYSEPRRAATVFAQLARRHEYLTRTECQAAE